MGASTPSSSSVAKKEADPAAILTNNEAGLGSTSRDEGHFNWEKQWYPVLAVKSTDPGRAHAVQLLGKNLVVWQNDKGTWATFDDRCPHRAAPLTEGRVEKDGTLMCAYHAWRFDSDGKCLTIPQSERGGKDEALIAACAKAYPTQVAQGLLWVWGENGVDAALESAVTPAPLIPELDDATIEPGRINIGAIYQRDLPYAWETFMENILDPSHVPISHHGIMGTRDMASPVSLALLTPKLSKAGFTLQNNTPVWDRVDGYMHFRAPALVVIDAVKADGTVIKSATYNIPTRPGWSRTIFSQIFISPKDSGGSKARKSTGSPLGRLKLYNLPDWLQHLGSHMFIHQDLVFLHHQEKIVASAGYSSSNSTKAYFAPTQADTGVIALRNWIQHIGSGGPAWSKGCDTAMPPRELNRDLLLDAYQQHTKSCTSCLGALKNLNRCLSAAKASAVASLTLAVLRGAHAASVSASPTASFLTLVTVRAMLPGLAMMFASLGSVKVIEILQTSFKFSKFNHQDNN